MIQLLLILTSIVYMLLIAVFILMDVKRNRDVFSATKVAAYFFLMDAFIYFYFAIDESFFFDVLFPSLASQYQRMDLVLLAYLLTLLICLFVFIGIRLSISNNLLKGLLNRFIFLAFGGEHRACKSWHWIVVLIIGVILYFYFMALAGGIYSYVSNLSMHVYNSAGINFIRSPMQTLLLVGYVGVFISMRNRLLKFLLFIFVLIILATLGGRASIGLLLFMLVLARYYFMGKNDKLISGRNALILLVSLFFMMAYVQYRSSDGFDFNFNKESIQEDIFRRLTILDRQIVSIGYFSDHPLWEGAIYATVSTAMIPRGLYPDKPPVDTGVYLYGISQGYEVSPPLPALMTFRTSWPDGYLAGYNSFGIVGVVFLSLLSGLFFGLIYNSFQKFPNLFNFYLYSSLGFLGVSALSPLVIVNTATAFVTMFFIRVIIYFVGLLLFRNS